MAYSRERHELIRRGDELACQRLPRNRVVLIAPDEQGWRSRRPYWRMTNSRRPIPRQCRLDRAGRNTVGGQTCPQPVRVVRQDIRTNIRLQKCVMVPGPPSLLTIWHFQRTSKGQGMRTQYNRKECQSVWLLIGDLPSKTGAPAMAKDESAALRDRLRLRFRGHPGPDVQSDNWHGRLGRAGHQHHNRAGSAPQGSSPSAPPHRTVNPRRTEIRQSHVAAERHIEHHARYHLYVSRFDHSKLRMLEVGRHHLPEGGSRFVYDRRFGMPACNASCASAKPHDIA